MKKESKIKVLHIISNLNVGGAEIALKRLILNSKNNKQFYYEVITLTDIGPIGVELQKMNIKVYSLKMYSIVKIIKALFHIKSIIQKNKPHIVQTWMYHSDLLGGVMARLLGCRRVIWGIRNSDIVSNNRGISKSSKWGLKFCIPLSHFIPYKIVSVSQKGKIYHANKGYARRKLIVIPNGYDIKKYKRDSNIRQKIRKLISVPSNALIIGSIGRFNSYKDPYNFILSAKIVAAKNNSTFFLMAGKNIDLNNKLMVQMIEKTGYADRFRLLGERNDIPDILSAIDIFCLHSRSEAFPNVLGEAMSASLPSVVTDVGDAKRILGRGGIVVPKKDANALAQGLLTFVHNTEDSRKLIGKIARTRIIQNYTIDNVQQQYNNLYKNIIRVI